MPNADATMAGFSKRWRRCVVTDAWFVRGRGVDGAGSSPADAAWTNSIHGYRGNILTLDGAVQMTATKELDALIDIGDDNGSLHFLVPN